MKALDLSKACFTILLCCCLIGCDENEYKLPTADSGLQNDIIKRSTGPNVVGTRIEFAYAAAVLPEEGNLESISAEASIAGAEGTYLENYSYHTNNSGVDIGSKIGDPSTTTANLTTVKFTKDTSAATLRYYYIIPEEARGKTIKFKFAAKASNGQTVHKEIGPFEVSKMDMALDLIASSGRTCFISIADMKVYDVDFAAANPGKIDLVYLHRNLPNVTFNHALVAPSAESIYLPNFALPGGVSNNTRIIKAWTVRDQQLARLQYGVFVDDIDLREKDFTDAPDFAINVRNEGGVWVETSDRKYRAYVYINSANATSEEIRISVKRLQIR